MWCWLPGIKWLSQAFWSLFGGTVEGHGVVVIGGGGGGSGGGCRGGCGS